MLGNVDGLKSLLMSIHVLCIVLMVSRQFLMLLVGALTMLQLLVPSWLSLAFLALCLNPLLSNLIEKWLTLSLWPGPTP